MDLIIPDGYVKTQRCTCGPNSFGIDFVPDKLFGLSIKDACCIHDFMYDVGETHADKERADRDFLENMQRIIDSKTRDPILLKLRREQALVYYQAVVRFGGPFFWYGKERVLGAS